MDSSRPAGPIWILKIAPNTVSGVIGVDRTKSLPPSNKWPINKWQKPSQLVDKGKNTGKLEIEQFSHALGGCYVPQFSWIFFFHLGKKKMKRTLSIHSCACGLTQWGTVSLAENISHFVSSSFLFFSKKWISLGENAWGTSASSGQCAPVR